MSQCLRITFMINCEGTDLHSFVQEYAKKFSLEGMIQVLTGAKIKVIACGHSEGMEQFVDALHAEIARLKLEALEVEPFIKDRDYRGVFRIIE